jgi:NADPH:quinone reductase-like Zn-dependent oxidoreductase
LRAAISFSNDFSDQAMQAFVIDRYKGELAQREMPSPVPGPGDVVVAIHAASVNPLDLKIRDGEFKLPLVALTAWQALAERAQVKQGQNVLIHAGSGGVGTLAIQLAKHLGATVATTAGTPNISLVKSLGADIVIDYRKDDFAKRLAGYDVVLNSLGADVLQESMSVLKPGGKLISISGPPDPAFAREIGANWVVRLLLRLLSSNVRRKAKKRGIDYSFLFMRADGAELAQIAKLVDSGVIRPVIDQVFPFERIPDAMARVQSGRARGKVIVAMSTRACHVKELLSRDGTAHA